MKNRRNLFALALAVLAFIAVVGLRDTFGPSTPPPQKQLEHAFRVGYERGRVLGNLHARANTVAKDVETFAHYEFQGDIIGPKRDRWEAGFVEGYHAGIAAAQAEKVQSAKSPLRP